MTSTNEYELLFKDYSSPPRKWEQVLRIPEDGSETQMDIQCDFWGLTELRMHLELRDMVDVFIRRHGLTLLHVRPASEL